MFTFMPSGESGSKVIDLGNAETENTYYFDGQRLSINANGRGKYEVRFKLIFRLLQQFRPRRLRKFRCILRVLHNSLR